MAFPEAKLHQGHSGASAAIVMREMEAIAKLGWDQWVSLIRLELSEAIVKLKAEQEQQPHL